MKNVFPTQDQYKTWRAEVEIRKKVMDRTYLNWEMACQNQEILGMSIMTRVRKKVNIRIVESWDTIRIGVRLPTR